MTVILRLKAKAKPWTQANIWFPGATPARSRNGKPFQNQCCLFNAKQPQQMLAIIFDIDSSILKPDLWMEFTLHDLKTSTKQPAGAEWLNEDWRISTHVLRKKMPNEVSCLSPALGNMLRVSSTAKQKTKELTKEGPIGPLSTDTCCRRTLLNATPLFSPVETPTGWEAECCQTTRHIFSPQVKRQLRRSTDPRKWDQLQGVLLLSFTLCDYYSFSSFLKKKWDKAASTCLFWKEMKRTILKWHFMYITYTLRAHGHSQP